MRRLIVFAIIAVGIRFVIRKMAENAGPGMAERCSEMCDRMLASIPESFPPNRMMADLESIKEQTARILEVLKEHPGVDGPQK